MVVIKIHVQLRSLARTPGHNLTTTLKDLGGFKFKLERSKNNKCSKYSVKS